MLHMLLARTDAERVEMDDLMGYYENLMGIRSEHLDELERITAAIQSREPSEDLMEEIEHGMEFTETLIDTLKGLQGVELHAKHIKGMIDNFDDLVILDIPKTPNELQDAYTLIEQGLQGIEAEIEKAEAAYEALEAEDRLRTEGEKFEQRCDKLKEIFEGIEDQMDQLNDLIQEESA